MKKSYLLTSILVLPALASCGVVSWFKGPTNAVTKEKFEEQLEEKLTKSPLFVTEEDQKAFSYSAEYAFTSKEVTKHCNNGVKIYKEKENTLDTLKIKFDSTNHLLKETATENQYYTYKGTKTAETSKESLQYEARSDESVYVFDKAENTYHIEKEENAKDSVDLLGKSTTAGLAFLVFASFSTDVKDAKYYVDDNVFTLTYEVSESEGKTSKEESRKVQFELNENSYSLIYTLKGKTVDEEKTTKHSEKGTLAFNKKAVHINYSNLDKFELEK